MPDAYWLKKKLMSPAHLHQSHVLINIDRSPRVMRLYNKRLRQGLVKERLKSYLRKFYGRYGNIIKENQVPLSRMLYDRIKDEHMQ